MSLWQRFTRMFSQGGRQESALLRAIDSGSGQEAGRRRSTIYDGLINNPGTDPELKARALFNRALASLLA
jgi:hypothetical protein